MNLPLSESLNNENCWERTADDDNSIVTSLPHHDHHKQHIKGFVFDKTLFIAHALEDAKAGFPTVILRPRGFGKSFNLEMLKKFVGISRNKDHDTFFKNTKIENYPTIWKRHYQKHPVILISFASKPFPTYEEFENNIKDILSLVAFEYQQELSESEKLTRVDKNNFNKILMKVSDYNSLFLLVELLNKHFESKVILLVDEYDTPLISYVNTPMQDKVHNFFFNMFSFLKRFSTASQMVEQVIFCGIVSLKERSYLSGFNSLVTYSMLNDTIFAEDFGVTEGELHDFLKIIRKDEDVKEELSELKYWYGGYDIGNRPKLLYNVGSLSCYFSCGNFSNYYRNKTGFLDQTDLLVDGDDKGYLEFIDDLNQLTLGAELRKQLMNEYIDLQHLSKGCTSEVFKFNCFWKMLCYSGYLTWSISSDNSANIYCLRIPNNEVRIMVEELIVALKVRQSNSNTTKEKASIVSELIQLSELKKKSLLTEVEFEQAKKKLLDL